MEGSSSLISLLKQHLTGNSNNELDKISEWLKVNNLSLNITKTKYVIFHTTQIKNDTETLITNRW